MENIQFCWFYFLTFHKRPVHFSSFNHTRSYKKLSVLESYIHHTLRNLILCSPKFETETMNGLNPFMIVKTRS